MRLDLFLKKTRLIRQRTLAKEMCEARAVSLNGKTAKPGQSVRPGDRVRLQLPHRDVDVRVLDLPRGNVARRDVERYIEVLRDERIDHVTRVFGPDAPEDPPDPDVAPPAVDPSA
ncbi:MAG: S4 domain-containing protein [Candidatus Krumholzibacteriia bacterium]